jgi:8-oxo-dGTP diphosphatase
MDVFLVRHAKAGSRSSYAGDDSRRPLSEKGRAQADALASQLGRAEVERVLSSPFTRCLQTVEPLASTLGLPVELADELSEGEGWAPALALVTQAPGPLVLCSHGDVIGELVARLERRGVPVDDDRIEKGSVWVLSVEAGEVVKASYRPPAAD